jgi:Glycosyl hydrolases family 6/Glycosyltransferase like family 2
MLRELRLPFEWVGIADAEDLFHPHLLRMVDYRFRLTGAGIVQCGVQLTGFSAHSRTAPLPSGRFARLRRWVRTNASGWWRAANVLEYYKWFQSRLKLQAATKVMPLGGDTVFFRRDFLEAVRDREFVIDTSRNGAGPPPDDPQREDEWCNPAQQARGTPPTTAIDRPGLAALLWIKAPGKSDGKCGGETTYLFSPGQLAT